jgi:dolichol kinase
MASITYCKQFVNIDKWQKCIWKQTSTKSHILRLLTAYITIRMKFFQHIIIIIYLLTLDVSKRLNPSVRSERLCRCLGPLLRCSRKCIVPGHLTSSLREYNSPYLTLCVTSRCIVVKEIRQMINQNTGKFSSASITLHTNKHEYKKRKILSLWSNGLRRSRAYWRDDQSWEIQIESYCAGYSKVWEIEWSCARN